MIYLRSWTQLFVGAVLLHGSSVILVLVLLSSVLAATGKRGRVIVMLGLIAIACALLANWEMISVQLFGKMRTSVYLGAAGTLAGVSISGGLRNAALLVFMTVLPYLCCRYMARIKGTLDNGLFGWDIGKPALGILSLNAALIVILPTVFLTSDFMRFERHGMTLALGLFAMIPGLSKGTKVLSCKALYVAVCLVFAYFYVANTFDSVHAPLLNPVTVPSFFAW